MKSIIHKAFLGLASCIFGLFSISAMADTFYFVHNDHLGAPLVITDENKQVVWEVDRDPWGNITNQITNALPNNVSLPGQYYDVETGYHQNWNRDYDSSTGRYLQSDPVGLAGGVNTYGYAYQNPVMFIDPMGLAVGDWWDAPANYKRAKEIAKEELGRTKGHNDIGDAKRHSEWMRRTTAETNRFTAWSAGTGHELDGILRGQPWDETKMDLHNNSIGRDAGADNMPVNSNDLWALPLDEGEPWWYWDDISCEWKYGGDL